jgi:alkylhydroperoxidase family enzyme
MPTRSPEPYLARLPELQRVHAETQATVVDGGTVESELKELCARYLADEPNVVGADERQRAALRWAHAVAWHSDAADDDLWAQLHTHFSQAELVELGYFIAFTLGQQHWLATLGGRED